MIYLLSEPVNPIIHMIQVFLINFFENVKSPPDSTHVISKESVYSCVHNSQIKGFWTCEVGNLEPFDSVVSIW